MVPMTLVGAAVGFVSAIAVEGFRQAMYAIMRLYSEQEHLVAAATGLPLWARVVIPAAGATLGGLIMWAGQRLHLVAHGRDLHQQHAPRCRGQTAVAPMQGQNRGGHAAGSKALPIRSSRTLSGAVCG